MFKTSFIIFLIFIFNGCYFFTNTSQQKAISRPTKPQIQNTSIKGVINEVQYDDRGYCYNVTLSNPNKNIDRVYFCSHKFHYNKGDAIYAVFKGDNVENMVLISEKDQRHAIKNKQKNIKANINTPKEYEINFD